MSTEVYVYADWEEFDQPMLVGTLRSAIRKNTSVFHTILHGYNPHSLKVLTLTFNSIVASNIVQTLRIFGPF